MLSRRDTIKLGALGAGGLLVAGWTRTGRAAEPPAFSVPLAPPPVARPVRRTATADHYRMSIRYAAADILPGMSTVVMGYNGRFPGPTIRAEAGREVVVEYVNELYQAPARRHGTMRHHMPAEGPDAVVHLHGGLVSPANDGHPRDAIAPGASRTYRYPNLQPAATLWYHDHSHHTEAEMVFRGLAGFYLVQDPAEKALGLPCGRHDVPLMLRDARFDDTGQLVFEMDDFRYRSTVLVNGRPQPYFPVEGRKYRLRLLNASNMRYFGLELSTGTPMTVIASDGGLLPAPLETANVMLSPGERVDVVVDFGRFRPGTQVVLVNTEGESDAARNVMRFDVGRPVTDNSRVPGRLGSPLDLGEAAVSREVVMNLDLAAGRFVMDGRTFDMDRVDHQVKLGRTEIWTVHNRDVNPSVPHNIHLHGAHFQLLDRNGAPVGGHETGWKDTAAVPIGGQVRLKVRYDRFAGRYLYHCHLLDHSSMGMMAQLEAVS